MDYESYSSFGNQRRKGAESKTCTECGKMYYRNPLECNGNWNRRQTCGGECRRKRGRRLEKERMKESP